MINPFLKAMFVLLVSLTVASSTVAQQSYRPQADEFETPADAPEKLTKKTGSVFRRPAKKSPALQLEYAKELEADGRLRRAGNQYDALVHRWHHSEQAPVAQFAYARLLFESRRYEKSFKEFQYMVQFFPGLFDFNTALDYQQRIANHIMGKRWGGFLFFPGFESPERAIPLLEKMIINAPNGLRTPGIRLTLGMVYENTGEREDAVRAYESVMQHHPGSEEAQAAAFRKALCLADLSDKTPRDERGCRDALSSLASFRGTYPQSDQNAEVSARMETLKLRLEDMYYQRAIYYDEIEKKPVSARISYREFVKQFPASVHTPQVMRRIEALEALQEPSKGE
jgi:outer membrane protein assembly factor BamD (BamD/ComL family)